MIQAWPFEDLQNVAVITIEKIMKRQSPILYVTHDEDDGMWQFLDRGEGKEEEARILSNADGNTVLNTYVNSFIGR